MAKFVKKPMQRYIKYAYCEECGTMLNSTYETGGCIHVTWKHYCPKCGHVEYLDKRYPIEFYEEI